MGNLRKSERYSQLRNCGGCGSKLGNTAYAHKDSLICGSAACRLALTGSTRGLYYPPKFIWVPSNTKKCACAWCDVFVPEGYYSVKRKTFYCSAECTVKSANYKNGGVSICRYCGGKYNYGRADSGFCCTAHDKMMKSEQLTEERAGEQYKLLCRFIESNPDWSRSYLVHSRWRLALFFWYLRDKKIHALTSVGPGQVKGFNPWLVEHGFAPVQCWSAIKSFFDWLSVEELRTSANPVVPRSSDRCKSRLTSSRRHPYNSDEMHLIWQILDDRGTPLSRAAISLAEESGPRYMEVVRLQHAQVDLAHLQVFIALPTKNGEEGWVPFYLKARKYLTEWQLARPKSKSDRLFVHPSGRPLGAQWLRNELKRILCTNERGPGPTLARFSFHRLRHTMASNLAEGGADVPTIMRTGRWKKARSASRYIHPPEVSPKASYISAMDWIARMRKERASVTSSFDEFMKNEQAGEP